MSFCRWSSLDHTCDVYVYESEQGFVTQVASRRWVMAEPLPPVPDVLDDTGAWLAAQTARSAILDRSHTVPIGLPFDGKTFLDGDASACAATLVALRVAGYTVPEFAIEGLRAEAAEGLA